MARMPLVPGQRVIEVDFERLLEDGWENTAALLDELENIGDRETELVRRAHITMERSLDAILEASFFAPGHLRLDRETFSRKLALVRAIHEPLSDHWHIIEELTTLCNKIAHKVGSPEHVEAGAKFLIAFRSLPQAGSQLSVTNATRTRS